MSWSALDVEGPAASRDIIAAWLVSRTGQAVEERADGTLVGTTPGADIDAVVEELRATFGDAVLASVRALPEHDWSAEWRRGLGPRRIGRLVVAPSWSVPGTPGPVVVIDPETAFGTGEHSSTRSALVLLDRWLQPSDRVLDLGSGSGILAIAAVKLGAARAVGIDFDAEVEPVARRNAGRNGVAQRVRFLTGDAAVLAGLLGPAELILSNIIRSQNERLLPAARGALAPRGRAIFAGMEGRDAPAFRERLGALGYAVIDETRDEDWWAVAAQVP
ncbi:MAG: 50S ribosomal protein L11 methyltransferase [Gemmatimonadales bacterium]